jgi:malate dehydrogenase (oxaloacetate-decarboxylating)
MLAMKGEIYLSIYDDSLKFHEEMKGKIEVISRVKVETSLDLTLAYTPGVAQPCLEIEKDPDKSYLYTRRWNTIAVVSDGTAVLGLGDIGALASMPVMEGKCVLFKSFGDVDAFPIVVNTKDVDEIVETVYRISPSFGGINLEDISAPRCFEVERKLKEKLDIPVFHDDQHGTAIVTLAGLINGLKIVNKKLADLKIVVNGAGAAGTSVTKLLISSGVKNIIICDRKGAINRMRDGLDRSKLELSQITNPNNITGKLDEVIKGADVFIGVSAPGALTVEMVKTMNRDSIIFAMANPTPEIFPEEAKSGGARVIGTGRSDFPNQINNVLAFPGIFRGALDVRASDINEEMKVAAAYAIANSIPDIELNEDYIIPKAFDPNVKKNVTEAVKAAAIKSGVARIK